MTTPTDGLAARTEDTVTFEWMVRAPGRGEFTDTGGFYTEHDARRFAANDKAHGVVSTVMRREVRRGPWVAVGDGEDPS